MNSLRFRIVLIVFLAVTPLAGLIIYNNFQQRQLATLHSQNNLMEVVKNINAAAVDDVSFEVAGFNDTPGI